MEAETRPRTPGCALNASCKRPQGGRQVFVGGNATAANNGHFGRFHDVSAAVGLRFTIIPDRLQIRSNSAWLRVIFPISGSPMTIRESVTSKTVT